MDLVSNPRGGSRTFRPEDIGYEGCPGQDDDGRDVVAQKGPSMSSMSSISSSLRNRWMM